MVKAVASWCDCCTPYAARGGSDGISVGEEMGVE